MTRAPGRPRSAPGYGPRCSTAPSRTPTATGWPRPTCPPRVRCSRRMRVACTSATAPGCRSTPPAGSSWLGATGRCCRSPRRRSSTGRPLRMCCGEPSPTPCRRCRRCWSGRARHGVSRGSRPGDLAGLWAALEAADAAVATGLRWSTGCRHRCRRSSRALRRAPTWVPPCGCCPPRPPTRPSPSRPGPTAGGRRARSCGSGRARLERPPRALLGRFAPEVVTVDVEPVRQEVREASASFFLGRKGRLVRAAAPVLAHLRPGVEVDPKTLPAVVEEVARDTPAGRRYRAVLATAAGLRRPRSGRQRARPRGVGRRWRRRCPRSNATGTCWPGCPPTSRTVSRRHDGSARRWVRPSTGPWTRPGGPWPARSRIPAGRRRTRRGSPGAGGCCGRGRRHVGGALGGPPEGGGAGAMGRGERRAGPAR